LSKSAPLEIPVSEGFGKKNLTAGIDPAAKAEETVFGIADHENKHIRLGSKK
jgi:hypothetical protein